MASRLTTFLKLFIPDLYDKGTVVTDVFDPNFTKIDQNAEAVDNSIKSLEKDKLDKSNVSEDFNTAKKIEDKIKGINEKFKNFCPYAVGDIYVTTNSSNPSTKYLGTTWSKIEGRFLLGTSGGGASKQTGGSMSKTIQQEHLPNVKLRVDTFSLTTQPHTHNVRGRHGWGDGTTYMTMQNAKTEWGTISTESGGGQNTGTASPWTSALGSGWSFDITPSYYTAHTWLRTS